MKVSRPFGRGVMLMVTLLFVLTVSARAYTCNNNVCGWVSWKTWSQCSQSCGGGVRERTRDLCCPIGTTVSSCLLRCRKSASGATETGSCNTYCCRGEYRGSIDACNCPSTYTGACCERIYIQPGTNSTTATPLRPTSLYDFCPGARDYKENTGNACKPPGLVFICSYVIIVLHYFKM